MAEPKKSSRFGKATRITAILAVMAPVVTGIYQEGQNAKLRRAQTHTDQKKAEEDQRRFLEVARDEKQRLAEDSDRHTAKLLQERLTTAQAAWIADGPKKAAPMFCATLSYATAQVYLETESPRTLVMLTSAFKARDEADRLLVCNCTKNEEVARTSWFRQFFQLGQKAQADSSNTGSKDNAKPAPVTSVSVDAAMGLWRAAKQALSVCGESDPRLSESLVKINQLTAANTKLLLEKANLEYEKQLASTHACAQPPPPPPPPPPSAKCEVTLPEGESRRLRVFIQTPNAATRDGEASLLRDALNLTSLNLATGFKSPGIEIVGENRSPSSLQVRFTYEEDRQAADAIKTALENSKGCGMKNVPVQLFPMPQMQGRTDPGVLEVWWPKSSARSNSQ